MVDCGPCKKKKSLEDDPIAEFQHYFQLTVIPEWSTQYLNFNGILKRILRENNFNQQSSGFSFCGCCKDDANDGSDEEKGLLKYDTINSAHQMDTNDDSAEERSSDPRFVRIDRIQSMLEPEYAKINLFFEEQVEKLSQRQTQLEAEAQMLTQNQSTTPEADKELLSKAFVELYKGIESLYSYGSLNHTAALELFSAHEMKYGVTRSISVPEDLTAADSFRNLQANPILNRYITMANSQAFYVSLPSLEAMKKRMEKTVCQTFKVSRSEARSTLSHRTKPLSLTATFGLGLWAGIMLTLAFILILLLSWPSDSFLHKEFFAVLPIFRAFGLVTFVVWCWGLLVTIFTKYNINYVFIMNLDPKTTLGPIRVLKMASTLTSIFLICFTAFVLHMKTGNLLMGIPHNYYPFSLIIAFLVLFFIPLHVFYRTTRLWLLRLTWESLISPFSACLFVHFFFSDILTSMPGVFSDFEYMICFYTTGDWQSDDSERCSNLVRTLLPYTAAFPLWIRLLQCLRRLYYTLEGEHAANAFKYFFSLVVHVFGAAMNFQVYNPHWSASRIVWFVSFFVSTTYLFYWDIKMDWNLGNLKSKNFFLRDTLLFSPFIYYIVIVLDGIGRFLWTYQLTQYPIPGLPYAYHSLIFSTIEILRRTMWGVIRVELEQVNNNNKFCVTKQVELPTELRSGARSPAVWLKFATKFQTN